MSTTTARTDGRFPPAARSARRRGRARARRLGFKYLALIFFAAVVLTPLYVLLVTSFKGVAEADPSTRVVTAGRLDVRRRGGTRGTSSAEPEEQPLPRRSRRRSSRPSSAR